jgi:hypothetical protein
MYLWLMRRGVACVARGLQRGARVTLLELLDCDFQGCEKICGLFAAPACAVRGGGGLQICHFAFPPVATARGRSTDYNSAVSSCSVGALPSSLSAIGL